MKAIIEKIVVVSFDKSGFVISCDIGIENEIVIIKFFSIPIYRKEKSINK